jgi:hypothetical protein
MFDFSGFFFLGFVKGIVYHEKVKNLNELHDRLIRVTECVNDEMFANTWQETECCPDVSKWCTQETL